MSRRVLLLPALVALVGLAACAPTKKAAPQVHTATFSCTGTTQSWVVPSGVHQVAFDLYGAAGGARPDTGSGEAQGGKGGRATATLPVTPGETIFVNVGCAGIGDTDPSCAAPAGGKTGGEAGGGPGGLGSSIGAGGGGGASDVRRGGIGLPFRVLVAGGGGGAGASFGPNGTGAPGGAPAGGTGNGGFSGVTGGGGGTQSTGGTAGTGNPASFNGSAGNGAIGGAGGGASAGCPDPNGSSPGGGGGGGYFGGGGGGGDTLNNGGGGGGGGSSFGPAGTAFENGVRAGNGVVVVTYVA